MLPPGPGSKNTRRQRDLNSFTDDVLSYPPLPPREKEEYVKVPSPTEDPEFDDLFDDEPVFDFDPNGPPAPPPKVKKSNADSFADLWKDLNLNLNRTASFTEMKPSDTKQTRKKLKDKESSASGGVTSSLRKFATLRNLDKENGPEDPDAATKTKTKRKKAKKKHRGDKEEKATGALPLTERKQSFESFMTIGEFERKHSEAGRFPDFQPPKFNPNFNQQFPDKPPDFPKFNPNFNPQFPDKPPVFTAKTLGGDSENSRNAKTTSDNSTNNATHEGKFGTLRAIAKESLEKGMSAREEKKTSQLSTQRSFEDLQPLKAKEDSSVNSTGRGKKNNNAVKEELALNSTGRGKNKNAIRNAAQSDPYPYQPPTAELASALSTNPTFQKRKHKASSNPVSSSSGAPKQSTFAKYP